MNSIVRPKISEMLVIKSVAIVGVSARMGYYWAHSMLQWDHDLKVWLVSRSGEEVLGHKIYRNLLDIPEPVDYVIIAVPLRVVPEVLKECAQKDVKGATIFASGYSELGTEEGRQHEKEVKDLIHSMSFRVFGPNCMGLMFPKIGFAFMPTVDRLSGNVGFVSQSGGIAITVYTAAVHAGVGFSKMFSFGNAVDISPSELLDYLETDQETDVVGVYIEGTSDGKHLLESLKRVALKKPVVAVKGGRSIEGSRAVSSHTGALAGKDEIWDAAFRQANVVAVNTLEDLEATLSVFSKSPQPRSSNVGIIAISGGTSVIYTDLCVERGLRVPPSSPETVEKLRTLVRGVGNSVANPIDLAADYYSDQTMAEVIRVVGADPAFDSIILQADVHNIHQVASIMGAADVVEYLWAVMAKAGREIVEKEKKPVLVAIPDVAYPEARETAWQKFVEAGLPVFRNISEAVGALSRVCEYYETRSSRESS